MLLAFKLLRQRTPRSVGKLQIVKTQGDGQGRLMESVAVGVAEVANIDLGEQPLGRGPSRSGHCGLGGLQLLERYGRTGALGSYRCCLLRVRLRAWRRLRYLGLAGSQTSGQQQGQNKAG